MRFAMCDVLVAAMGDWVYRPIHRASTPFLVLHVLQTGGSEGGGSEGGGASLLVCTMRPSAQIAERVGARRAAQGCSARS